MTKARESSKTPIKKRVVPASMVSTSEVGEVPVKRIGVEVLTYSEPNLYLLQTLVLAGVGLTIASIASNEELHHRLGLWGSGALPFFIQIVAINGLFWPFWAPPRLSYFPRLGFFLLFCWFAGVNVGSWVDMAVQISAQSCTRASITNPGCAHEVIQEATAYTAGIFLCMFVSALAAPPGSSRSKLTTALVFFVLVGFWIMSASALLALLGVASYNFFEDVYVRLGLLVYSVKLYVDTLELFDNARGLHKMTADVFLDALRLVANVLHLFTRILNLLAGKGK